MTSLYKELEQARARVTELELKAEQERRARLALLPAQYGFESFEEFADAVRAATGTNQSRPNAISAEVVAGEAATPYWRDTAVETEPVTTTFVAQGIQASRSSQGSRTNGEDGIESATTPQSDTPDPAAKAAEATTAPQTAESSATPAPAAAPRPLPTGTSLSDPSQFGLLPDTTLLERGEKSPEAFRTQLNAAHVFAQQVLHTSRVPAAVWREWRDFARKAADALRGSAPVAQA